MTDDVAVAQSEEPFGESAPILEGFADTAHVFTPEGPIEEAPAAAAPDLPKGFAERYGAEIFNNATDIHQFFRTQTGNTFIDWFNAEISNKKFWLNKKIAGTNLGPHFDAYWNAAAQPNGVNLLEFIAYMCIFINERNGDLVSKSELFGAHGHPGIAYLFDSFLVGTPPHQFKKASYNKLTNLPAGARQPNVSAGDLFNNADFNAAHGTLPQADRLRDSRDPVWQGTTFPQGSVPTSGDPSVTGYVLQADFFKFRGRGLIQTTWRGNYAAIVRSVQAYTGKNELILSFKTKWKGLSPDVACTLSSNQDWDALFEKTNNEIVSEAIRLHAKAGGYLPLSTQTATFNGTGAGSIRHMGNSIGGGNYGVLMKARAVQISVALGALA